MGAKVSHKLLTGVKPPATELLPLHPVAGKGGGSGRSRGGRRRGSWSLLRGLWEPLEVGRGVREPRKSRESRLEHWIGRRVAKRKTNWDTRISIS